MISYELLTIIIVLTALFAYINHRFIKLPNTIGLMIMSLLISGAVIWFGYLFPELANNITKAVHSLDFHELLLNIMLSFLLFAGAIRVDAEQLRNQMLPVILMASIGILISTFVIGTLMFYLFQVFGMHINYIYCLMFGSLISPTDPVVVMNVLRRTGLPRSLELKIKGESLFNDGVSIVIFLTLLRIAHSGLDNIDTGNVLLLFAKETGGGLLFGMILGYIGFYLLKTIDNYLVEVQITLAMVMGGYMLADTLSLSAPIAIVTAGIVTGNKGDRWSGSRQEQDYIGNFWQIIDDLLNAILFLLIGFEMLVVDISKRLIIIGAIAIPVMLLARLISLSIPYSLLRLKTTFEKNAIPILTWGGLRGGISIAIVLSLPASMHRNEFLTITYIVVVFSIVVQGLSIGKLIRKLRPEDQPSE